MPKAARRDQIDYAALQFEHKTEDLEQEIIRQFRNKRAAAKAA